MTHGGAMELHGEWTAESLTRLHEMVMASRPTLAQRWREHRARKRQVQAWLATMDQAHPSSRLDDWDRPDGRITD